MRGRLLLLLGAAALPVVLGATAVALAAGTTHPPRASGGAATIAVRRTKLGRILVDGSGRTLYLFEKDRNRHSACSGACAVGWPPLMTHGKPKAARGAAAGMLGTTARRSGTQVMYSGHPLYRFAGDTKAGQTNGEGSMAFGAGWYVLAPNGHKIDKS